MRIGIYILALTLLTLARLAPAAEPAAPATQATDETYARIESEFNKDAASQDLVDELYDFMQKYPDDVRGDRVQYWVGTTQQRRKFHHEAIKEFQFVVSDFPTSKLVIPALTAEAQSDLALEQEPAALDCYQQIVARRPSDWTDERIVRCYHDALVYLADAAMRGNKPDVDGAAAYDMQLPDAAEAVSRCVQLYASVGRIEDAMNAIHRLPDSQRLLGYRLMVGAYAGRPGVANLNTVLDDILTKEKPSDAVDDLLRYTADVISSRGPDERRKVLGTLDDKYDRLKRWAEFGLCEMDRAASTDRLVKFIADYHTGGDVEQAKVWIGEFFEAAGQPDQAREAYQRLTDAVGAHFKVAETYYGPRAKTKDLPGGQAELTNIVKRFYSPEASAEALWRRAALEHDLIQNTDTAIATLEECVDRFGKLPDHATRALMRLGELFREQKKPDEAIKAYEKLVAQYADQPVARQAWLEIGYSDEEAQRPQQAIDVFKSVLRKYPHTHEASVAHSRLETKYDVDDTDVSDR